MDNMEWFFTEKSGRKWYVCRDCGNREPYKSTFCPVCLNKERNPNKQAREALEALITIARLKL